MNHLSPEILESLSEGQTPSSDQAAHLQSCQACAAQVEGLVKYLSLMKSLPRMQAPSGFSARLRARLEAESAVPRWKKILSALFSTRRIPLQLAGAGFAALLLFWALPRYPKPVLQSETEIGKGQPLSSPATSEAPAIIDLESGVKDLDADKKESRSEPPRNSMPKKRASVKTELPKKPASLKPEWAKAPASSRAAAAPSRSKSESSPAPRMEESFKSLADESQAGTGPTPDMSPPPSPDAQLRALGFHKEIRKRQEVHILRLAKSNADSVQARLKEMGLEKLLILHDLPGDSLEIEIR